jgi:hypothetical protein
MRYCAENKIKIVFTQYGNNVNKIEETIIHGERVVEIQIGNFQMEEEVQKVLLNFMMKLKNSL